jgi:dTDP-L-rhamnose 4-epimerase
MRVLVTGAAGFIGSHVAAELAAHGHEVVGLDCLHPAAHGDLPSPADGGVPLVVGDVRDPDVVRRALEGVDAVAHHAAMVGMGVDLADLPDYVSCNDLGTAVLLAAMARTGVGRLVLASSMVVYGEGAYTCVVHGPTPPSPRAVADLAAGRFEPRCLACGGVLTPGLVGEDAPLQPRSVYAATKVAQEHLAAAWARATGSAAVALRYHNVYGPRMPRDTPYSGVAAIFRSALERGEAPTAFEDGGQRRDFVHVADVARANLAALHATGTANGGGGLRAYNIASGQPHTVAEMATALARAFGGPAPVVSGEFRAGDVRHIVACPERARRELGFTAEIGFEAGMAEFAHAPLRA